MEDLSRMQDALWHLQKAQDLLGVVDIESEGLDSLVRRLDGKIEWRMKVLALQSFLGKKGGGG